MNHHTYGIHHFLRGVPDEQANCLSMLEVVGCLEFLVLIP